MIKCPNCGHAITDQDQLCPSCGFNVEKYRKDYFSVNDQRKSESENIKEKTNEEVPKENPDTDTTQISEGSKLSRSVYRKREEIREKQEEYDKFSQKVEYKPKRPNSTVDNMILWLQQNTAISCIVEFLLLVVMSFSRPLGWICFLVAILALFIVCTRKKATRYTADKNLTAKFNQVFSNIFNAFDDRETEIKEKNEEFNDSHPKVKKHVESVKSKTKMPHNFGVIQLSILVTSIITLILLFTGTGAAGVNRGMTIFTVMFNAANKMVSGGNIVPALLIYLVLLMLIFLPIFILLAVLENKRSSRVRAFILSLCETAVLIYIFVKINSTTIKSGYIAQATSQLKSYTVALGISWYLLLLMSIVTTALTVYNMFQKMEKEDNVVDGESTPKRK